MSSEGGVDLAPLPKVRPAASVEPSPTPSERFPESTDPESTEAPTVAKKIFELRKERAKLIADARVVTDDAAELRSLSSEDQAKVDKMLADIDALDLLITKSEKIDALETSLADAPERRSAPATLGRSAEATDLVETPEYRKAFGGWLGSGTLTLPAEFRDLTLSGVSNGGALVTPTQLAKDIIQIINNLVFVRQMATIDTVTDAQSLGIPSVTNQPSDALWTSEVGPVTPDASMALGRRDLTPNLLSKLITISLRLLQVSSRAEALVNERLGYKFAVAQENAFLNGSGIGQPLGVFTASPNGIPASSDVVVSASGSTQITADLLIAAKYAIKQPYLASPTVAWAFSRQMTAQIRLLKDNYGRYLWVDGGGLTSAPEMILGIPNKISEYVPSVLTSGSYVGILGDWKNYRIVDCLAMQIQRLVEAFALNNEVGLLGRFWTDGCPVLPEAWARLKLG